MGSNISYLALSRESVRELSRKVFLAVNLAHLPGGLGRLIPPAFLSPTDYEIHAGKSKKHGTGIRDLVSRRLSYDQF